ncbi:MAG: metallophosphoesterase [Phycisphaeraceae bacterium]|nr:metallophosphoesterase [Phycisphaeraceae bacterium]
MTPATLSPRQIQAHRRRRFRARLRHAAFTRMPVRLSRGRVTTSRSMSRINLVQRSIALPQLPAELHGLRIAHLSDLHVGDLLEPDRLPDIVQATNDLGCDLIALTGDFVDLKLHVLPEVIAHLSKLSAPLGVWMVTGNHDYLVDGPRLIAQFRQAGLSLLVNESRLLHHRGQPLVIAGIDYSACSTQTKRSVADVFRPYPSSPSRPQRREKSAPPRILLAHHPHAFESAYRQRVDLTLSGHTHGGQLVLTSNRGRKGSISLGGLACRYPRGLYRWGDRYLYVTAGIGSWFPLRIQCPAEIACLTLCRDRIADRDDLLAQEPADHLTRLGAAIRRRLPRRASTRVLALG